jgi:hypothetical protein
VAGSRLQAYLLALACTACAKPVPATGTTLPLPQVWGEPIDEVPLYGPSGDIELTLRRAEDASTGACLWVATTEVTQALITSVDPTYPDRLQRALDEYESRFITSRLDYDGSPADRGHLVGERLPAIFVTVRDAMVVANELSRRYGWRPLYDIDHWDRFLEIRRVGEFGLRLPTRDEWKLLAPERVGDNWTCGAGNLADRSHRDTWYRNPDNFNCDDTYGELAPVGNWQPMRFGLYDTIGNVSEMTETEPTNQVAAYPRGLPPHVQVSACGTDFRSGTEAIADPWICRAGGGGASIAEGFRLVMSTLPGTCPEGDSDR